jgi:hypothetical protein
VRNKNGDLRAIAAVLVMGDFVSIESIVSHRGHDRAQEFLEVKMWKDFVKMGISVVDRGSRYSQSASLQEYKEKFAPIHTEKLVCAHPIIY